MGGDDLSAVFTVRWKAAGDPDSAYVVSTATETTMGITFPVFDENDVPASGDYIVHSYDNAGGPTTGTKITVTVDKDTPCVPVDFTIPPVPDMTTADAMIDWYYPVSGTLPATLNMIEAPPGWVAYGLIDNYFPGNVPAMYLSFEPDQAIPGTYRVAFEITNCDGVNVKAYDETFTVTSV